MPLLLLYGKPNSGKTTLANEAEKHSNLPVKITSPDLLNFTPEEQISRSTELFRHIYSFVQQNLDDETLVIVDSTNHTKSFRYELYCVARERKTLFAVLLANEDFGVNQKWKSEIYSNLVSRQEEILQKSEWDNPNFTSANECVAYLMKKSEKSVKRATQVKKQINVSIVVFLNQIFQKIISMQRVTGVQTTVQIVEGQYFDCKKMYTVEELNGVKDQFIAFWMKENRNNFENQDMGRELIGWLEKL